MTQPTKKTGKGDVPDGVEFLGAMLDFGARFFMDITYKINWFSIGVNAKYPVTEDFRDEGLDLHNYRVGFQVGIMF
jgi:hypothetical protein